VDEAFAFLIKELGNVVLASYFTNKWEYITPLKIFKDSAFGVGYINKPRDKDLVLRNGRGVIYKSRNPDKVFDYSLEIKTICSFLDLPLKNILFKNDKVLLRDKNKKIVKEISIEKKTGFLPTNYRCKFRDFKVVPIHQVLLEDLPEDLFRDKIVIVGMSSEVFHDVYPTPLGLLPGAIINANNILMILNNDYIKKIPWFLELMMILFLGFLTAILTYRLTPHRGVYFNVVQILILILISKLLFLKNWHGGFYHWIFIVLATCIGINVFKYLELMVESLTLKTQAATDGLTGLFAFRYFKLRLHSEWDRAVRMEQSLALIMADVDHFKEINDRHGHRVGNLVLKKISQILLDNCRSSDVVCRYGGDEFVIIMANTSIDNALNYAERVRVSISDNEFKKICDVDNVSLSLGIASIPNGNISSFEHLIEFADMALYKAKNSGRNRSCVYTKQEDNAVP